MTPPRCPDCGGTEFSKSYVRGTGWTHFIDGDRRWHEDTEHVEVYGKWTCGICGYVVQEGTYLFSDLTEFFDTRPANRTVLPDEVNSDTQSA